MFNLIWKDILIQKRQIPLFVAIIAFCFWMDDVPLWWIAFITSISFIMNAFYYDEKDNINILLNSLPYTRKQIVISKYIGAIVFTALFIGIIIAGDFIINGMELSFSGREILYTFGLAMACLSIIFPFFYKFKQQYLMIGAVILFIVVVFASRITIQKFSKQLEEITSWLGSLPQLQLYSFTALVVLLLYGGSWLLSLRLYEKKVF
jgi:ABC-2 type transport system permease protein